MSWRALVSTERARRGSSSWRCFAAAWVWTHHPPRVRAGGPPFSSVNSCPVSGLPPSGFPRAALVFTRQLVCLLGVTRVVVSASQIARRVSHAGESEPGPAPALTAAEIAGRERPMRGGGAFRDALSSSLGSWRLRACQCSSGRDANQLISSDAKHQHHIHTPPASPAVSPIHASRPACRNSMHLSRCTAVGIFCPFGEDVSSQCGEED